MNERLFNVSSVQHVAYIQHNFHNFPQKKHHCDYKHQFFKLFFLSDSLLIQFLWENWNFFHNFMYWLLGPQKKNTVQTQVWPFPFLLAKNFLESLRSKASLWKYSFSYPFSYYHHFYKHGIWFFSKNDNPFYYYAKTDSTLKQFPVSQLALAPFLICAKKISLKLTDFMNKLKASSVVYPNSTSYGLHL